MPTGTIQGVFHFLLQAFNDLGTSVPNDRLEKMAVMIYCAMCNPARNYHNLDHVFNFSTPPDPIRYLAAVFHDIVYYQVDNGLPTESESDIQPYLRCENGVFSLADPMPENHGRVEWLLEVFGFHAGQQITFNQGLNEFLSALVTVKNLGGLIEEHDLFQVVVCIEATIPFRGQDESGRGHFEKLAERLRALQDRYPFFGTPEQIDRALQRAVIFSNQDVETFRMEDPARFLVITFKLLPENNIALRKGSGFTVRDYRIGLQNMERFLRNLNPEHVFNSYKGVPSAEEYALMVRQASKNLCTALRYLEIKLLALALLEGLAEVSGGDAPISLFVGDRPQPGVKLERLEQYLPDIPVPDFVDPNSELLRLFNEDLNEITPDLPYSPISSFIYKMLPVEEQDRLFEIAEAFFSGSMPAEDLLASIPRHLLSPIANAVAELAFTRREKLLEYVIRST
jgi:hypothetical protein